MHPNNPCPPWRRWGEILASKQLLHLTIPGLMLYLVLGTVAQKSIGLYEATHKFFMAPVVLAYGIPLPGMPVFIAVLVVNLLAHLCLHTQWTRARTGTILTHVGVVMLLLGALLTSLCAEEGFLDLREGARAAAVSDYHQRELVVRNLTRKESYIIPFAQLLHAGQNIHPSAPQRIADQFTLTIQEICRNCALSRRTKVDDHTFGMARGMQLSDTPLAANNEENMAGLSFTVHGTEQDGLYTALENVAVIPQFSVAGQHFSVAIEKQRRPLPFTVELLHTSRTVYPGTDNASAYQSRLRIHDQGRVWESEISMNQPMRYKGYALYQSSYAEDAQGRRSVIAVVYNPVRTMPYLAGGMIMLGMLWHIMRRQRSAAHQPIAPLAMLLLAMLFAPITVSPAHAADADGDYDLHRFSFLPVASDGRIKPLDSLARERMEAISGTTDHAMRAFFTILFQPVQANDMKLIRVADRGVRSLLELPPADGHRYSAAELSKAFARHRPVLESLLGKPEQELTEEQRNLRQSYASFSAYQSLSHSFDAFRPLQAAPIAQLPAALQQKLGGNGTMTYETAMPWQGMIEQQTKALAVRKGSDFSRYSSQEQALAYFSFMLAALRSTGEKTEPLNIVHNADYSQFVTPWGILLQGQGGPGFTVSLEQWKQLLLAADNPADWNRALQSMLQHFQPSLGFYLEWYSNSVPLLPIALYGYAATLVLLLALYVARRESFRLPAYLLGAAIGSHAMAILLRILILSRPPVGTLYESILFAGLLLALGCLWRFARTRAALWLWQASVGGVLLLLLAMANDHAPGDNKIMLTAVLNTNFWLTTHVLTITAGYAFSILTALLAHRLLLTRHIDQAAAYATLKRAALVALLFSATGTMLGGIWADQSWGRFWGWDPKENGALLLVLWLVWFLHGDVTRSMPRMLVMVGFALTGVVVALSWFGVNLLNIGLHSYGFTQGVQWGLLAFAVIESVLIGAGVYAQRRWSVAA